MAVHQLTTEHSLIQQYVAELRDVTVQTDRARFRKNIERIGQIMAYEISKKLEWKTIEITTPLGTNESKQLAHQPVLATILRAGISMHHGFLDFFDKADCAFISAYRKHKPDSPHFDIVVEYLASPSIENKDVLLIDPMLATGQSIESAYQSLRQRGKPKSLHIVSLIASESGIDYVKKHLPEATIWVAAIDNKLDENGYIVPGLGDAGDLCFGEKI